MTSLRLRLSRRVSYLLVSVACLIASRASASSAAPIPPEQAEFFEKQIRPVLVERCYECHNSTGKKKGGLALDWKDATRAGGDTGPAVVPGKAEESLLIRAIRHEKSDLKMPKDGPKLADPVVAAFTAWINLGAPDPRDHAPSADEVAKSTSWESIRNNRMKWWSFQPIRKPTPPAVHDGEWSKHPVDRFILAKLEAAGLKPAADADRQTLIRRVTFDLTGLPPKPADTDAFLKDQSPDAYEKVVDRLLASPHFGEAWARHWMDWMRYTDSHGSEGDPMIPYAWRYRDYLIRALNADVPYDQLVREHLAGDLLPAPRIDAATGINESAIGIAHFRMVQHGFTPTDAVEEQITFTDNQIDVVSKTFLGLTVSCARCHNHKFDPISQADFYALYGIFVSARPALLTLDSVDRQAATRTQMRELKTRIRAGIAAAWLKAADEFPAKLLDSPHPSPKPKDPPKPAVKPKPGAEPPPITGWQASIDETAAIGPRSPLHAWLRLRDQKDNALRTGWKNLAESHPPAAAASAYPLHWDFTAGDYAKWFPYGTGLPKAVAAPGQFAIRPDGEPVIANILPAGIYSHLLSSKDSAVLNSPRFKIDCDEIWIRLSGRDGARVRLVVENYARVPGLLYPFAAMASEEPKWIVLNCNYWKGDWGYIEIATAGDLPVEAKLGDTRSGFGVIEVIGRNKDQPAPRDPEIRLPAMASADAPTDAAVLAARYGDALRQSIEAWRQDRITDEQANFLGYFVRRNLLPTTLATLPDVAPLVSEYRHLESTLPTPTRSPGLLEAVGFDQPLFIRGDHKQIGDVIPRRFLEAIDATPYHVRNSGRLQLAESILSPKNPLSARVIANRLWHYVFGEGIVPTVDNFGRLGDLPSHPELLDYLATHLTDDGWSLKRAIRLLVTSRTYRLSSDPSSMATEQDPTNRLLSHFRVRRLDAEAIRDSLLAVSGALDSKPYGPTVDGRSNRRSVYVGVRRTALDPFLGTFDAPQPFTTRGRREVTNVPAQSLTLLNDPFVIDQANHWANDLLHLPATTPEQRINRMFVAAFARDPKAAEREEMLAYLKAAAEADHVPEADLMKNVQPWSDSAHSLFNLKEFIYLR